MKIIRRIIYLSFLVLLMLIFFPLDYDTQNVNQILHGPSLQHLFGTDSLGRDFLARVLLGGRISIVVGILSCVVSLGIATFVASAVLLNNKKADRIILRSMDIFGSIPEFISATLICLFFQNLLKIEHALIKSILVLVMGISLTHWVGMAKIIRGYFIEIRQQVYFEAAIALGAGFYHIFKNHVFRNVKPFLLSLLVIKLPMHIFYESLLSFIGLGIYPPYTSWGILIKEGWLLLQVAPHMILFPTFILFCTMWLWYQLASFTKTKNFGI